MSGYAQAEPNLIAIESQVLMSKARIKRRDVLVGVGAMLIAQPVSALAASSPLIVTPGQTEGPFYPVSLPADMDADLVRVQGQKAQAMGQVTHVSGRVLDRRGEIVHGAMIEIWQCDARGIYNHPRAPGQGRHDAGFQGYGRTDIDATGRYAFRTIRPVAYPGRTPHIHFKVHVPGIGRLTTQLYVAGEPQNATDGVLGAIRDRAARESVVVRLEDARDIEAGALKGTFDIVLDI
jgi:protocatechuate 3,4-dioxygenase beta subunit